MATITRIQPQVVGSILNDTKPYFLGGPEQPEFGEAASQTYDIGDLLTVTSGKVAIATVDGSSNLTGAVLGIAKKAATGVTDAQAHVLAIRQDTILAMNVYHATPGSALLARSQLLSTIYAIKKVSNVWCVDIETTSEAAAVALGKVRIIKFLSAIGDAYGRVLVQFAPFTMETDNGACVRNLILP